MLRKNVKSLLEQLQVCIFAEIVFGVRCTLNSQLILFHCSLDSSFFFSHLFFSREFSGTIRISRQGLSEIMYYLTLIICDPRDFEAKGDSMLTAHSRNAPWCPEDMDMCIIIGKTKENTLALFSKSSTP